MLTLTTDTRSSCLTACNDFLLLFRATVRRSYYGMLICIIAFWLLGDILIVSVFYQILHCLLSRIPNRKETLRRVRIVHRAILATATVICITEVTLCVVYLVLYVNNNYVTNNDLLLVYDRVDLARHCLFGVISLEIACVALVIAGFGHLKVKSKVWDTRVYHWFDLRGKEALLTWMGSNREHCHSSLLEAYISSSSTAALPLSSSYIIYMMSKQTTLRSTWPYFHQESPPFA